jgi:sigma-B regulation protein RsbU (phosphoserine phosphatase)
MTLDSFAPKTATGKVLVAFAVGGLLLVVFVLDLVTGLVPDLTVLYLLPIIIATLAFRRVGGLVATVAALALVAAAHPVGHWPSMVAEVSTHFAVFVLTVLAVDLLNSQLHTIRELESQHAFDLRLARDLHQRMLGKPPDDERFEIATRLVYARELGGDYYSFDLVDGGLLFSVGDISGKGAAASLFTVTLRQSIAEAIAAYSGLAQAVESVDSRLSDAMPDWMFVTTFFGTLDAEGLTYSNAGHVPPLLYRARSHSVIELDESHSPPLGIAAGPRLAPAWVPFEMGDMLLVVTDGVTDSQAIRNDSQALRATFVESVALGPEGVADRVRDLALGGEDVSSDDITVVCIRRRRS